MLELQARPVFLIATHADERTEESITYTRPGSTYSRYQYTKLRSERVRDAPQEPITYRDERGVEQRESM